MPAKLSPVAETFGEQVRKAFFWGSNSIHVSLPNCRNIRPQILEIAEERGFPVKDVTEIGRRILFVAYQGGMLLTEDFERALQDLNEIEDDPK